MSGSSNEKQQDLSDIFGAGMVTYVGTGSREGLGGGAYIPTPLPTTLSPSKSPSSGWGWSYALPPQVDEDELARIRSKEDKMEYMLSRGEYVRAACAMEGIRYLKDVAISVEYDRLRDNYIAILQGYDEEGHRVNQILPIHNGTSEGIIKLGGVIIDNEPD